MWGKYRFYKSPKFESVFDGPTSTIAFLGANLIDDNVMLTKKMSSGNIPPSIEIAHTGSTCKFIHAA